MRSTVTCHRYLQNLGDRMHSLGGGPVLPAAVRTPFPSGLSRRPGVERRRPPGARDASGWFLGGFSGWLAESPPPGAMPPCKALQAEVWEQGETVLGLFLRSLCSRSTGQPRHARFLCCAATRAPSFKEPPAWRGVSSWSSGSPSPRLPEAAVCGVALLPPAPRPRVQFLPHLQASGQSNLSPPCCGSGLGTELLCTATRAEGRNPFPAPRCDRGPGPTQAPPRAWPVLRSGPRGPRPVSG